MGRELAFRAVGGGGKKTRPSDVPDRAAHARALLASLDVLTAAVAGRNGVYLEVSGRAGEPFVTDSLDKSDLKLLRVRDRSPDNPDVSSATVFASGDGLRKLRKKVADFETRDRADGERRPFNADLVQSIGAIIEAGLRALWRSPPDRFPQGAGAVPWEIWLDKEGADKFIAGAAAHGVAIGVERLEFPEDVVVIGNGTATALAAAVRQLTGIRAIAAPSITAEFFDGMPPEEQGDWAAALTRLATHQQRDGGDYLTLLDTGIGRANPLIAPALRPADRHAADPAWALEDIDGHGTQLAGLALYGDLTTIIQQNIPVEIRHRLEAVKIIPDAGHNPYHLLGAVTRAGINAVEAGTPDRRRTFAMASTTVDDTPHDGAPTSWSSELDQLCAGVSGNLRAQRLIVVSAGNSNQNLFGNQDYLAVSDHADNEVEAPAQAWNAIAVGANTEKTTLPHGLPGHPLAPFGDLSPSSRTASWSSHWPIKPDVVLEGGNWLVDGMPPPLRHDALSLLTTDNSYPARTFTTSCDTSAATALAARMITRLRAEYPLLWPETIRALFIASARWTPQMLSHLPIVPQKGDYGRLFQRYGYGVPNFERASSSASNALALIAEDTITPYRSSGRKNSEHVHNEMKVFALPWPVQALRQLGNTAVRLRVALSSFVEPNPSEPARGSKFSYASHNLRFKLNRPNENEQQFVARISAAAAGAGLPAIDETDGWTFGRNRRDVGSVQIDELTCRASDLARRNLIAVHPVTGWWKTDKSVDPAGRPARFALVVEIDAEDTNVDLYAEVQAEILNRNLVVV